MSVHNISLLRSSRARVGLSISLYPHDNCHLVCKRLISKIEWDKLWHFRSRRSSFFILDCHLRWFSSHSRVCISDHRAASRLQSHLFCDREGGWETVVRAAFGGAIIHWDVDCAHGTHTYHRYLQPPAVQTNFGSYLLNRRTRVF